MVGYMTEVGTTVKDLSGFEPLFGTDFYLVDQEFQDLLRSLAPSESQEGLHESLSIFSRFVSEPWNRLAEEIATHTDGPQLEQFDEVGNRIDRIWLPQPIRQLRREVVAAGIFNNASTLEKYAKVYLLGHLGESSLACPLACTEGLIQAIEVVGSPFLKTNYLPKLRSVETPLAGSQFITEQDMGSDVGALTTRAIPDGGGFWRLYGEKWFCSAIDEYFLVAGRTEAAPEGTKGVSIFLVPRILDGHLNEIRIKRLKDKLGTRHLPTAEIDLNGAVGYNIGPVENGFKNLMSHVLNTSRMMNAACALGVMARSLLEGRNYARQRKAFGKKIIEFPMVREMLSRIEATLTARRALYFHMIRERDRQPAEMVSRDQALWQRFLINCCKYRTATGATQATHEAMMILAGNGTIETFSCLPRLYRDSLVIETWEGTHNTLALQIARDGLRFPFRDYLDETISKRTLTIRAKGLKRAADWITAEWERTSPALEKLPDADWALTHSLHLVDRLGALLEVTLMGELSNRSNLLNFYIDEVSLGLRPL